MELGGRATGCNRSPVRNAVATGLAQFRNAKDRKKPVRFSPVRFFPYLGIYPNRSRSGCLPGMPKNRTGPDFQTLITIQWITGHKGVEGNELADEQAKKAITEGSSNTSELPRILKKALPHCKSAIKCAYSEKLKRNAQKAWQKSLRYERMKNTDPTTPSRKYIDLITDLPRKIASILSQLRTGHAPLAKHLHRIGKIDSPLCPGCKQSDETVQHLLLHCTAHQAARQALRNSTGGREINITKLLTTPKTLPALFRYIAATGRFRNTFGDLPTLSEEQQRGRKRR